MCVIIVKERGQKLISKENLKKCFTHNSDGAGIAWTTGTPDVLKPISIEKGFMKFDDLWNYIVKLGAKYKDPELKDLSMILHCRITTHGMTNKSNTHPFPLSDNEEDLCAISLRNQNKAIAHNGTIASVKILRNHKISDTMEFIKNQLYPITQLNKDWNKSSKLLDAIGEIIESKLAILNCDGTINRVGTFTKNEEDDLWYSNMHWNWNTLGNSAWRKYDKNGWVSRWGYSNWWDDDEFNCYNELPSYNDKWNNVDSFVDIDKEENEELKLDKLMNLIDNGVNKCKGSEVIKLFMNDDYEFIKDILLTEEELPNASYYGCEGDSYLMPIDDNGLDESINMDEWEKENKDKTFVFDIIFND